MKHRTGFVRHVFLSILMVFSMTGRLYAEAPVVDMSQDPMGQQSPQKLVAAGQSDGPVSVVAPSGNAGSTLQSDEQQALVSGDAVEGANSTQATNTKTATPGQLGAMEHMQETLQTLQGTLEMQSHEIKTLHEQQKQLQDALDKAKKEKSETGIRYAPPDEEASPDSSTASQEKSKEIKTNTNEHSVSALEDDGMDESSSAASGKSRSDVEDTLVYNAAFQEIKTRNYSQARVDFNSFVKDFPKSKHVASAHYWLGELNLLAGDNEKAEAEFKTVVTKFSDDPKASDASLKLGLIYYAAGKWEEAQTALRSTVSNYPDTPPAKLAQKKLKAMLKEGHTI